MWIELDDRDDKYVERLDVAHEIKTRVKNDTKMFGCKNCKKEVLD